MRVNRYFRIDPWHMWVYYWRTKDFFGVFRNLPGVVKWLPGRTLPRRWGFRFWGVEFGERG